MSRNLSHLSSRKGLGQNLFESLVQAKGDPISLKQIAARYKIGEANTFGAASAYDFIQGNNANKKAYLCNGSSCLCAGTQSSLAQALSTRFAADEIGEVTCLGRCHENAAFQINGQNYSGADIESLDDILQSGASTKENYRVECLMARPLLTETIDDHAAYYRLFLAHVSKENSPQKNAEKMLQQVIDSGLRGRGGAGFPTGTKWQSCAQQAAVEKYIVCNADEGDPGAFSDRYLLEERPHAVLFGMLVAGYTTDAKWGVLYIRDEYPQAVENTANAIAEFEALNLLSDLPFEFQFKIIRGAGAYICGEETALLRSIEGQRPVVSVRPPFPTVKGLFDKPTVVNNVETFAAIHWILDNTGKAFAAIGNGRSTGSKLLSLDSSFVRPGILEVAMGEKLSRVIEAAGGFKTPVKALHIGGPLGGLVPTSKFDSLTLDFESFAGAGFLLGHASIIGIPESQKLASYIRHLFAFTAAESCGKCFPCRLGATRGKEMWHNAISGEHKLNRELLDDLLDTMERGSLCALGGGVPLPVKNALQYFADELAEFFECEVESAGESCKSQSIKVREVN